MKVMKRSVTVESGKQEEWKDMRPQMSARAPSWRVENLDLFLSVMSKALKEFNPEKDVNGKSSTGSTGYFRSPGVKLMSWAREEAMRWGGGVMFEIYF